MIAKKFHAMVYPLTLNSRMKDFYDAYEPMESYSPAVARGATEAPPAIREWAVKLEAKPKYVVSSTRRDFPWTNSRHLAGDLRTRLQQLKDATPAGVLVGCGKLAASLDRLND